MYAGKLLMNLLKIIAQIVLKPRNLCAEFQVTVVRARDKLECVLRHYLIEDRSGNGAASYVEFLCYLHKEIRALLS